MAKLVSKTYGDALFELALEENHLDEILDEYDIEYIIWAQDVAETGNRSYMKALNPLLKKGGNG